VIDVQSRKIVAMLEDEHGQAVESEKIAEIDFANGKPVPPQVPVLADGLFPHTAKTSDPFETDNKLPNITCEKCTLQIVQFMAEHGVNKDGGYFYHHCSDLQITVDPAKPTDRRWSAAR
jgi:hypothetical protein